MILEVALLNIRLGESADFERAFAEAQAIIAAMAGCGWGVQRMVEADTCYAVPQGGFALLREWMRLPFATFAV
jgi:hypothetical protein